MNKKANFKCTACGKVFSSAQGFALHRLRSHGNNKQIIFKPTAARPQKKKYQPAGSKARGKKPIIALSGAQTIDIPVILRVPIEIGNAQFIGLD